MRNHTETRPWSLGLMVFVLLPGTLVAQETRQSEQHEEQIEQLKRDIQGLESEIRTVRNLFSEYADEGSLAFLAGAFCALWAKNSGRNAWVWFFCGAIFVPIAVLVLLYKNTQDIDQMASA